MLALLLFSPAVYGFSFTVDNPNPAQCGQLDINWVGGTPPFRLLVLVSTNTFVAHLSRLSTIHPTLPFLNRVGMGTVGCTPGQQIVRGRPPSC